MSRLRIHLRRPAGDALCGRTPEDERLVSDPEDATCRRCLRIELGAAERRVARVRARIEFVVAQQPLGFRSAS